MQLEALNPSDAAFATFSLNVELPPKKVRVLRNASAPDNTPLKYDSFRSDVKTKAKLLPRETVESLIDWANTLRPSKPAKKDFGPLNPENLLPRCDRVRHLTDVLKHLINLQEKKKTVDLASLISTVDENWMTEDLAANAKRHINQYRDYLRKLAASSGKGSSQMAGEEGRAIAPKPMNIQ